MGYVAFFLLLVAAGLLWAAACTAAAARTGRGWLRWLFAAVALTVPVIAVLPLLRNTVFVAFGLRMTPNWFAPTSTAFLSLLVGGVMILRAGLRRRQPGATRAASAWPAVGLFALSLAAAGCTYGTLLAIDNAVEARFRGLPAEAARIVADHLPAAVPEADDAAPLYLRAAAGVQEADDALAAARAESGPEAAAVLARHGAALDALRAAADRPGCRFVRDWSRPSLEMEFPELDSLRVGARVLAAAARAEAAAGDRAAAIRDVVRIGRIARHVGGEPVLVAGAAGIGIDATAFAALADVLPLLEADDLAALDDPAFGELLATVPSLAANLAGEEAMGLTAFADVAAGRFGVADGDEAAPDAPPLPARYRSAGPNFFRDFLLPLELDDYRERMGRLRRLTAAGPEVDRTAELRRINDEFERVVEERRCGLFTGLLLPVAQVAGTPTAAAARRAAATALVAATRERLAGGTVPESLAALVPGRLAAVPPDPYAAGQPLHWKRDGDELVVYGVGLDGEDDGGPVPEDAETPEGNDDIGLRMAVGR